MKQQEILKKIGNILKELHEQYDYLQTEETNLNDLELELFAANAKFLTDHTEILRKINAQKANITLTLPEHTGNEPEPFANVETEPDTGSLHAPIEEMVLPPLDQNAIEFTTDNHSHPEPEALTPPPAQPAPEYTPIAIDDSPQPTITIEPATERDSYDFMRHEPQISNDQHSFSISSHADEPVPEHVDLSAYAETETLPIEEAEPVTPEPAEQDHSSFETVTEQPTETDYAEPVHIAPAEPEPVTPVAPEPFALPAVEETKPIFTHEAYQPAPAYTPPVTETPKQPEAEQPLTLNQRLSAQLQGNTPPSQSQQAQPVTDIKAAISLNDKLLFVKELFNGYGMAYGEAIELLNRCKSFDEADRFLKTNYVAKNNWPDKPTTVDKFYAILRRRFTA
jgi:hypothetical protein